MTDAHDTRCWVCGHPESTPYLDGSVMGGVAPSALRITDSHYGLSAPLVQCTRCGLIYADPPPSDDLVALYEQLEDPDYLDGTAYRLQQMRHLLEQIVGDTPPKTMLDVGAGSGLLVEAARERGIDAVGVEPSRSLAEAGRARQVPVYTGLHPHPELAGREWEMVTCVDVIEHVRDPAALMASLAAAVRPRGRVIVTTPDPESIAARLLGKRWWHHRVAHVCFFPHRTMEELARRAGLEIRSRKRQKWWFSAPYLAARATALLASSAAGTRVQARLDRTPLRRVVLPLDLRDSWVYECVAR